MYFNDTETKDDIIEWYEGLIDFLQDHVPCLDDLIQLYEDEQ
jgi:hypothetical protein